MSSSQTKSKITTKNKIVISFRCYGRATVWHFPTVITRAHVLCIPNIQWRRYWWRWLGSTPLLKVQYVSKSQLNLYSDPWSDRVLHRHVVTCSTYAHCRWPGGKPLPLSACEAGNMLARTFWHKDIFPKTVGCGHHQNIAGCVRWVLRFGLHHKSKKDDSTDPRSPCGCMRRLLDQRKKRK